ncbi:MAG: Fic family protein [Cytophagales bacterium]|nr:Fic family protein [Cytophagales bacterium]
MRRIRYIHELGQWPDFTWDQTVVNDLLAQTRYLQGKVLGRMESLGFNLQADASLLALTHEIVKSSEIEGEMLPQDQVRSSLARKLGLDVAGLVASNRNIDGIVELMLDATQNFKQPLTAERLFHWHRNLFPDGFSGAYRINTGNWRTDETGPMQVVSGPMGKERIHFEAPAANRLATEMEKFLLWFNSDSSMDLLLKSAVAHFWFITIHPFDDGNGRIARALSDMLLARSDNSTKRFYSLSAQIRKERNEYYNHLEKSQNGDLNITQWISWYLTCLSHSLESTTQEFNNVLAKATFWEKNKTTALNARQKIMLNKLLDGFEGKLNTSKWAKITKTSQDTAMRDIHALMVLGILEKENAGGRSTHYTLRLTTT